MASKLNAYLNFNGNAREAMSFYESVFGGTADVRPFRDSGVPHEPGEDGLVLHSQLDAPNGMTIMASDTPSSMEFTGHTGFGMSLSGDDEAELTRLFAALSDGGTVTMPMNVAPWGDTFGMCVDRFGISWSVDIAPRRDNSG